MRKSVGATLLIAGTLGATIVSGSFYAGYAQTASPPSGSEFDTSSVYPFAPYCGQFAASPCPDPPGTGKWSVNSESPGQLRIWTQFGSLLGTAAQSSNNARNLILQPANPAADYTVTTRLTFPANTSQVPALGQTGGIIVYQDDDNFIYVGRDFTSGGSRLEFVQEINGVGTTTSIAESNIPATVYLRLVKSGSTYAAFTSYDNFNFSPITLSGATATAVATSTGITTTPTGTETATPVTPTTTATSQPAAATYNASYSAPKVGLFAWGGTNTTVTSNQIAADFDWFRVGSNSQVPGPTASPLATSTGTPPTATSTASTTATPVTATAISTATSTSTPVATSTTVPSATSTTVPTATNTAIPTPTPKPTKKPTVGAPKFQFISLWYHVVRVGTYDVLNVQGNPHTGMGIWVKVYFPNGKVLAYFENTDSHGHWLKRFPIPRNAISRGGYRQGVVTLRLWRGKKSVQSFVSFTLVR